MAEEATRDFNCKASHLARLRVSAQVAKNIKVGSPRFTRYLTVSKDNLQNNYREPRPG